VPQEIKTQLTVVMHVSEREKSTNTVRLLKLLVPQTSVLYHGERDSKACLSSSTRPRYLLFPDDSAAELNDEFAAKHPEGISLVVPDGNWHQARKMTHRHPELIKLPRVRVSGAGGTLFAVRRAPRGGFLSTIEAIALALTPFEGQELANALNNLLYEMVRRTLWSRLSSSPMPPDFSPTISTSSMNKG
jgi:DTW domain-containing protein YfiP